MTSWPEAWADLVAELRSGRGQPAFIDSSVDASALVTAICDVVDEVISVGELFAQADSPAVIAEAVQRNSGRSTLLVDIDGLFAPQLGLDVVALTLRLSQRRALLVCWPGRIDSGRMSYSLPGRPDYVHEPARGLVVLRPVSTHFPDEVPYTVERYLA